MTKITDISQSSSSSIAEDSEETRVRKFAKHMLKSTLFIGTFQEKRFVEPLNSYRDVIKVSDDETDLVDNLIVVRKRLTKFYRKDIWIGITEPKTIGAPAGYNIWVSLDEEVFGSYWYKIKTVEFQQDEVRLRVEIVRPVVREKTPILNITPQQVFDDLSQHNVSELTTELNSYIKKKIVEFFTETLTYSNIKDTVVFIFLLTSTLITFSIQGIKYLLDYILKFLHELSGVIKVSAPIIISFMRLIASTINGFYNLIGAIWRDKSVPKINQNLYQIMPYDGRFYTNNRALPYPYQSFAQNRNYRDSRSQVQITPLD